MSDLTSIEKLKLEKLLEMGSGYVVDFSNKTFQEFILENSNIDIYDEKYDYNSGSKANRLRAFWKEESNYIVAELLEKLLEYWTTKKLINQKNIRPEEKALFDECQKISERLKKDVTKKIDQDALKRDKFSLFRSELLLEFDQFASLQQISFKPTTSMVR